MKMANEIANSAPSDPEGVSPLELFSQTTVAPKVRHSHTFGSPIFVLDTRLHEAGQSIGKWAQRLRVGIYLGTSPRHSRKIALVLSLQTGHVSPQFHVKFDDYFETLHPNSGNSPPISHWQIRTGFEAEVKPTSSPSIDPATEQSINLLFDERNVTAGSAEPANEKDTPSVSDVFNPIPAAYTTRSGRTTTPTPRMQESLQQQIEGIVSLHVTWEVFSDDGYQIQTELEDPIAFAASNNPDVMHVNQALKAPDRDNFVEAMKTEVQAHTDNKHWVIVHRSKVPDGVKVLPAVWAMRRKRRIATQEVYKWKARLNIHGGKQEHGVNYWETYAPVISWTTIRLYLILALINGWETRQLDFVLAYPQADIEVPMYMDIPQGFSIQGSRSDHCLLLKKNLYGQKQAGRVWNHHLHDGLLARGFVQSNVDMCLYFRGNVAMLIYTDDGILIAPTQGEIDTVIDIFRNPCVTASGQTF
jgi:Reverse transcriptase (RNA-dependent DNA polymerase)